MLTVPSPKTLFIHFIVEKHMTGGICGCIRCETLVST